MANNKNLFDAFFPISKEEWLTKVEKDLKGKAMEELNFQLDDINISPIAHADDLSQTKAPIVKSNQMLNDWMIGETITVTDLKASNILLLEILSEGVNAPLLKIDTPLSNEAFNILFDTVEHSYISTHFEVSNIEPFHFVQELHKHFQKYGNVSSTLKGSIHFKNATTAQLADAISFCAEQIQGFNIGTIDARPFCKKRQQVTKELAACIYHGNAYLSNLLEKGVSVNTSSRSLQFLVAVDTSYFISIAKIRALKLLWANVLKGYDAEAIHHIYIDAQLAASSHNEDANTNMIRSTTQAMSAAIAGVDRLTVLPSNAFEGEANEFSRRIARNVQHILKMESYLDRVNDPAAGSYYIEQLTDKLARKAWEYFQATADKDTFSI